MPPHWLTMRTNSYDLWIEALSKTTTCDTWRLELGELGGEIQHPAGELGAGEAGEAEAC